MAPDEPLVAATRPAARGIFVILLFGVVSMAGMAVLLSSPRGLYVAAMFGVAAWMLVAFRLKTVVYDDRIVQGRLGKRTVQLADAELVVHVDAAAEAMLGLTALTEAQLDEVTITDHRGVSVYLSATDIPESIRERVTAKAIAAAADRADATIDRGGTYAPPGELHALYAGALEGTLFGMALRRRSSHLSEIVSISERGVVTHTGGCPFQIGLHDCVLRELLRRRRFVP